MLDRTSFLIPIRIRAIIFRGGYSISLATGQEAVQIPHWMQAQIFSPPIVAATSSTKLFILA
ncbi:hypothetical protein M1M86_02025 [Dehalococcoidales bacterium]|nr:hypothetical protein [Dehalococcoidales bacterium]MCL0094550.1 hypothetical protein [Dehalococcoidales bacterium]